MRFRIFFIVIAVVCLAGCQRGVSSDKIFDRYDRTVLKFSNSSEVLSNIRDLETELLSQSESVVASCGEKKRGSVLWFNVVAFDEDELTAVRKYGFFTDEKAVGYFVIPAKKLKLNAEAVLSDDFLAEPYANENARRIAAMRLLLSSFSDDIAPLTTDSQTLNSAAIMFKQVVKLVLTQLDQSPALAAKLSDAEGMEFIHTNYGFGRVGMTITSDRVRLNVKIARGWFHKVDTL